MYLNLQREDGTRTAYFGISDFRLNGDGSIELYFHNDVAIDTENEHTRQEGEVIESVSETGYNEEGAYETIGDLGVEEGTEVIVGVSELYPWVEKAARRLAGEDDYEGDLTIID